MGVIQAEVRLAAGARHCYGHGVVIHPGKVRMEAGQGVCVSGGGGHWVPVGRDLDPFSALPLAPSSLCRPGVCLLRGPTLHARRHHGHLLLPVGGGLAVGLQPGGTIVTAWRLVALP